MLTALTLQSRHEKTPKLVQPGDQSVNHIADVRPL